MEPLLAAVEATTAAQFLRASRWGYAAVNATHILGISVLVGAILPLDLRLLGAWRGVRLDHLARVLVPAAACGLGLAVVTGLLLFATRASEYADNNFLRAKLVLVALAALLAVLLHRKHGLLLEGAGRGRLAAHGAVSMICWLAALGCGRMIAFTDG